MFGSRRGPLHPELATWLGSVHVNSPDELAEGEHRRGVGGRKEEEEEGEGVHLESLTWQVGKNRIFPV